MIKLRRIAVAAALAVAILAALNQAKQARIALYEGQKLREQQSQSARQIIDLQDSLADKNSELAELLAENSRLKSNPNEMELLKLRGEVTRLRPLQEDVVALQKKLQQSSANLPTWKTNELADVGNSTPIDAVKTLLYSVQNSNVTFLQQSIVGDDVNPPSPEALQNYIKEQSSHPAGNEGTKGYRIISETWLAPDKVQVELSASMDDGVGISIPFTLRNVNGEWKFVVFNVPNKDGQGSHVDFLNNSRN